MTRIQGMDQLVRTLNTIKDKAARKAARAGLNAGLTPLVRAIRAGVNSSPVSQELKRAARATLNKSVRRPKSETEISGKAGFAVGRQTKVNRAKAAKRAGDASQKGIGVSAQDIHWFVLGTKARYSGGKNTFFRRTKGAIKRMLGMKSGYRGRLKPTLSGIVQSATARSKSAMLEAARSKVSSVLAVEAAKARKG